MIASNRANINPCQRSSNSNFDFAKNALVLYVCGKEIYDAKKTRAISLYWGALTKS